MVSNKGCQKKERKKKKTGFWQKALTANAMCMCVHVCACCWVKSMSCVRSFMQNGWNALHIPNRRARLHWHTNHSPVLNYVWQMKQLVFNSRMCEENFHNLFVVICALITVDANERKAKTFTDIFTDFILSSLDHIPDFKGYLCLTCSIPIQSQR